MINYIGDKNEVNRNELTVFLGIDLNAPRGKKHFYNLISPIFKKILVSERRDDDRREGHGFRSSPDHARLRTYPSTMSSSASRYPSVSSLILAFPFLHPRLLR